MIENEKLKKDNEIIKNELLKLNKRKEDKGVKLTNYEEGKNGKQKKGCC